MKSWTVGVKRLKQSRIPIVKVRWNSKRELEFTWEWEDKIKSKYPDHKLNFKKKFLQREENITTEENMSPTVVRN